MEILVWKAGNIRWHFDSIFLELYLTQHQNLYQQDPKFVGHLDYCNLVDPLTLLAEK